MVYIRQEQLPKLREYRYAGIDLSLVSRYVLKPFYNDFVIKFFPMSMAPNAITLTGFFFVVVNFFTILWYNPTLDQDCPSWVYASCAIGLFLYQTFDGVDGIQARRTKQSGPLGELFDHSVDACNTALGVLIFAAAMNLGQSWATLLTLFGSTMTFYVQTWDEYYTQVLTLGVISGPVEGVLTLCVVFGFTAFIGGGSFWHRSMLETIGVPKMAFLPDNIYDMAFTQWYLVYGGILLFFATGSSIVHVMQVRCERKQDPIKPLYGLLPLVAVWTLVPAYLYLQPTILENYMVPFCLYVGMINAYAVGRMICAHLVKASFPYFNMLLIPLALAVLDSAGATFGFWSSLLGDGERQVAFIWVCLGLSVGIYGSFVHDIITTICDYIDIWCLTIKHPHVEVVAANGEAKKSN
ncbi:Choline/ethanolaminephosphotransferase [Aspergillus sclerotioniger CBS 115572]|uniref:diacylglycerol cholinephosphotransferase n=1 Tax=Aspergillus sclerotioniger CBS 115572 TaxID=1450535 RepID=A0A317VYM1_9EURO|nr:Choline/ethanolaminephosphotransferase [Aspergillus sclerotioniger CBS 115572]PWY79466.1 Choline/ethanolaminephosphotransferase [Aspergillus sclerotioniger CBS 115572]